MIILLKSQFVQGLPPTLSAYSQIELGKSFYRKNTILNKGEGHSMFEATSLLFKTMVILGIELGIVFLGCLFCLKRARLAYDQGRQFLGVEFIASLNDQNEIDLQPIEIDKNQAVSRALTALMLVFIASMYAMVSTAQHSLTIGLTTMTITSIAFAPVLAMIMLQMDENDGLRAMKLTILITIATGVIGMYSGVDFSFMRGFLFFALLGLLALRLVMLFTGFANGQKRVIAFGGAILFTLFLLYDFNRLANLQDQGYNDWSTALNVAINLYLDVLNLLLEILQAMGDS